MKLYRMLLPFCPFWLGLSTANLLPASASAQGTKGFSSQTQGSELIVIDRILTQALADTIAKDLNPSRRAALDLTRPRAEFIQAKQDSSLVEKNKYSFFQLGALARRNRIYNRAVQARAAWQEARGQNPAVNIAGTPRSLHAPTTIIGPTAVVAAAETAIDDAIAILALYDDLAIDAQSRKGLGKWHMGIVTDGDFNKSLSENSAPAPKTGSLGIDAVFMKPVYYTYTYSGNGLTDLAGRKTIMQPSLVFNTLAILFAQSSPLSTSLVNGANPVTPADTKQFGQALLVPGSNAQGSLSFTVNASYFPLVLWGPRLGRLAVDGSLNLTQTRWESRGKVSDVNIFAPLFGLSYKILDEHILVGTAANTIQAQLFARYSGRHLFGDIERHPYILSDALGNTNRTYHGIDIGFTTSINAIRLTVNVPVFEGEIEGFSNGQPVLGLGLAAAIKLN